MKAGLYLVTPPIADPLAFRPLLIAALEAAPIICVWLKVSAEDDKAAQRIAQAMAQVIQDKGVAVLIDAPEDLRSVARGGFDGVHLNHPESMKMTLEALKPDRIVGAGGLNSRDEAMSAGESGVDYVMFGEPRADGTLPPFDKVLERCTWWAEVFTVPCVGYAHSAESVSQIASTGVEFIALGDWVFTGDITQNIKAAVKTISAAATPS
jgi:thiamine-phosphate pyrophosphorylase